MQFSLTYFAFPLLKSEVKKQMVYPKSLIGITNDTDWSVTHDIRKLTREQGDLMTANNIL